MDTVTLIAAALAAGATAGTTNASSTAITDAYQALKSVVRRKLTSGREDTEHASAILEGYEADPQQWHDQLISYLAEADVDRLADVVGAAQSLLGVVDPSGARSGKYAVEPSMGSISIDARATGRGRNYILGYGTQNNIEEL
jgi:hypothetical protein